MQEQILAYPARPFTLTDFLSARNAELPAVVRIATEAFGIRAGDTLLAAGSIVEGLGNNKSDLDLLLIVSNNGLARSFSDRTLVVGSCLSDVDVLALESVTQLIARFDKWCEGDWEVSQAAGFSIEERRLLHRLRHCVTLFDGTDGGLSRMQPRRERLAKLKLQSARHLARTIQVDMAGFRDAGDTLSLGFAAQDLLGYAADALTAGYLLTNPTPKWRSRLMSTLPEGWWRELPLRVAHPHLRADEFFWRLHRAPDGQPQDILDYARRIVAFARVVFLWAERRLLRLPCEHHPRNAAAPSPAQGTTLPGLDLDVDFAEFEQGAGLARLNEFGDVFELSSKELDIALLFDAVTTVEEAAHVVFGHVAASTRGAVEDLAARIDRSGLCHGASRWPGGAAEPFEVSP